MSVLPGLLSTDQIDHYDRHGYVVIPNLIPKEVIETALFGVERYYSGERDWMMPLSGGFLDWRKEHGDGLRINDYVSLQNHELRDLVSHPSLGAAFADLARAPVVRLFHDQLISKAPDHRGATAVGWHVDGAYWRTCTSDRMLTAWIPLRSYDDAMGPLHVIPGSHRWDGNGWMTTFTEQTLDDLLARVTSGGEACIPELLRLRPGDVSFHHARTIHGSPPNRGREPRLALTVHVQDGDNRYRRHVDCRGRVAVHVNDALCRKTADGVPDYADDEICPVLWARRGS